MSAFITFYGTASSLFSTTRDQSVAVELLSFRARALVIFSLLQEPQYLLFLQGESPRRLRPVLYRGYSDW